MNRINILMLEDSEERLETFKATCKKVSGILSIEIVVKSYKFVNLFIDELKHGGTFYHLVTLDHDLDDLVYVHPSQPNTGSEAVRQITNQNIPSNYNVHSFNVPAATRMAQDLQCPYCKEIIYSTNHLIGILRSYALV